MNDQNQERNLKRTLVKEGYEFRYKQWFARGILSKIIVIVFSLSGIGIVIGAIHEFISNNFTISDGTFRDVIIPVAVTIVMVINISIMANLYPKMKIQEEGLEFQMFFFFPRWILIPWTEIKSISKSYETYHNHELWVVSISNDLPKWQNAFRREFKVSDDPAIVISSDLEKKTSFTILLSKYLDCSELSY